MFVKICGITNEDDALFAVAMGADAVGFIFAPSTRQVAAQTVYDMTRRLPPEVLTVGVFKNEAGQTPVLAAVKQAERALLDNQASKAYLGMLGDAAFNAAIGDLVPRLTPAEADQLPRRS